MSEGGQFTDVEVREEIRMLREAQAVVKDVAHRLDLMLSNKPEFNVVFYRGPAPTEEHVTREFFILKEIVALEIGANHTKKI